MFKKVIAAVASLALALGIVALTAGSASAHTPDLSATCTTLSVNLSHYANDKVYSNTLQVWVGGVQVENTPFGATFSKDYSLGDGTVSTTYRVKVDAWDSPAESFDYTAASPVCLPDDTNKTVLVCHYSYGTTFTAKSVDYLSILNGTGHGGHPNDIIPPFDYVKQGVAGSYPGQNWTALAQLLWNNNCLPIGVAPSVSFVDAVCTAAGQVGSGTLVIPTLAGVTFQAAGGPNGPWTDVTAGNVPIAVGLHVYIRAIAQGGYTLTGTTTWNHTFTGPSASTCVQPAVPTFTEAECTAPGTFGSASYSIPTTPGASYTVSINDAAAAPVSAGVYPVPAGTKVVVTAVADFGYTVQGPASWTVTFATPNCDVKVTPAAPGFAAAECTGPGTYGLAGYTIPTSTGVYYSVSVNGGPDETTPAGDYSAPANATVVVTPHALFGYVFDAVSWNHPFTAPNCDVTVKIEGDPSSTDQACERGTVQGGSIWVDRLVGVQYTIKDASDAVVATVSGIAADASEQYADGTVTLPPGSYTVTAAALPGYTLDPESESEWSFTIHAPATDCVVSFSIFCSVDEAGILTLPAIANVLWTVTVPSSSTTLFDHVAGPISIPVTLAATAISASLTDSAHVFATGQTVGWSVQLEEGDVDCGELITLAPIPTALTFTSEQCVAGVQSGGTLTVGQVEGVDFFDEMNYYLDGSETPLSAATTAIPAGHHTVVASPVDPDNTIEEGSADSWSFDVLAAPATCDLTTLALTGANPLGWAGAGYFLLVSGLALIAVRTVRRRSEVK